MTCLHIRNPAPNRNSRSQRMEAPSSGLEEAVKAVATEEVLQRDCSRRSTRVAGLCSLHSRSQAAAGARE